MIGRFGEGGGEGKERGKGMEDREGGGRGKGMDDGRRMVREREGEGEGGWGERVGERAGGGTERW